MTVLRLLAFLAPLSLESFAVAAAFGAGRPTAAQRWRLTALFVAFEGGMPIVGLLVGAPLAHAIGGLAHYVAALALAGVGIWLLLEDDSPDGQRVLAASGLALVGVGLSISVDELAIGFTLGLARVPVVPALVGIAVQALAAVRLGLWLGTRVSERWRERTERLAGIVLIVLGVTLVF